MKFLKSLLVSVALIVTAASANAANQDLGTLTATENPYYSGIISTPGSFTDYITFTLTQDTIASFGAGVLNYTVGNLNYLHISDFNQVLLKEGQELGSGLNFTLNSLTAGVYQVRITGIVDGGFGGQYAGGISIAAVPEPSSVAMLLVGFAALGAVARRRKSL